MIYRKLKRVSRNGYGEYIPEFKKVFPELKDISSEEMSDRWGELKISFYSEEKKPVKMIMRFSMPFALILIVLLAILLPFNFLVTGKWHYSNLGIYNWFKSLNIAS